MGIKDDRTTAYFENPRRFADLWNGVIYGGDNIINPHELVALNTVNNVRSKHGNRKVIPDNIMEWWGKYLRVLVQENQAYIDYHMVFRNMLTEAIMYDKQWKEYKRYHEIIKDYDNVDEFISKMKKDDKYIPVITLVVNLSNRKWDGATNLYDTLNMEDDPLIREYISNYKLNLYDYHEYDSFDRFTTELKQVFSFLRYSDDEIGMMKIIEEDKDKYTYMDEETAELIGELTNTKGTRNGGTVNMCKAFEDHYNSGRIDERRQEIKKLISKIMKKITNNKTLIQISDELDEKIEDIRDIYNAVISQPGLSAEEIYEICYKNEQVEH